MKSSISQIKDSLRDKKISVEELYDEFLIKAKSSKTNSFNLLLDKENNILSIKESQKRYENGNPLPLDGIPLGLKICFAQRVLEPRPHLKFLAILLLITNLL